MTTTVRLTETALSQLAAAREALAALGLTPELVAELAYAETLAEAANEDHDGDVDGLVAEWGEDSHEAWLDTIRDARKHLA